MNRIKFADLEQSLERRKALLGLVGTDYVLPNSGVARTSEKRVLLRALRTAATERGKEPAFSASIEPSQHRAD